LDTSEEPILLKQLEQLQDKYWGFKDQRAYWFFGKYVLEHEQLKEHFSTEYAFMEQQGHKKKDALSKLDKQARDNFKSEADALFDPNLFEKADHSIVQQIENITELSIDYYISIIENDFANLNVKDTYDLPIYNQFIVEFLTNEFLKLSQEKWTQIVQIFKNPNKNVIDILNTQVLSISLGVIWESPIELFKKERMNRFYKTKTSLQQSRLQVLFDKFNDTSQINMVHDAYSCFNLFLWMFITDEDLKNHADAIEQLKHILYAITDTTIPNLSQEDSPYKYLELFLDKDQIISICNEIVTTYAKNHQTSIHPIYFTLIR